MPTIGDLLRNNLEYTAYVADGAFLSSGLLADRPVASTAGRLYYVTDTGIERFYRDTGTAWEDLKESNIRIENRTSDPASPLVGQLWLRTDL